MAVSSVAWPLGFLIFLSYGEWELLIFFAKALGPAEVVSWAMLGYIWSMLKYLSDGIADAAESRCAIHLVSNQPERARLAAYKSNFLGFVTSIVTTSILFMASISVTGWISQDSTLQRLMIETFPLIGIGNVVRSIGIVSASVLGAQGRAGIANLMQFLGIWCITIPLSAIFTYGLLIDLQGLTTAVVLGLALSGAGNTYLLLRSDWIAIASTVSEGFVLDHDPNQGGGG
jgi:Na+-driven multidrug efflux pump